jgi:hypothetical protein
LTSKLDNILHTGHDAQIVTRLDPSWMKVWTFAASSGLILVQAAGYRRPIAREDRVGFVFGGFLGVLYSVTTISGLRWRFCSTTRDTSSASSACTDSSPFSILPRRCPPSL